ncbi:DUF6225 family protein [Streptomyces sp. NPDC093249]|uniref:DUF6225 family protein n=1 Tax=unclassified Streptomyces TaxID=2593676 RepID=UPI00344EE5D2
MGETFEHDPVVWTAGQLREALKDVPDDTPLYIGVAPRPDAHDFDDQVLVGYAAVTRYRPATESEPARKDVEHTLFAQWPGGRYTDPG